MSIRRLTPADATAFQALRLAALLESPTAFGSSYEEELGLPQAVIESRLAPLSDRGVFGAVSAEQLVGLVGLGRETKLKLMHKAMVWGLYVAPAGRGRGWGRALLLAALQLARTAPGTRQVNLSVNANNHSAILLYESQGFKVFGREPGAMLIGGQLHDEVHMVLRLHDD
jgi:ribosomal protein S18 acetylase RimI-like enzyme